MEKVIITLRRADADDAWCTRMRAEVATDLLDLDLPGLTVNVRDDMVRHSLMTLTTLDPPVVGLVTVWTQQSYGEQMTAAITRLESEADDVAAYLVTESVPMPPPRHRARGAHRRPREHRAASPARRPGRGDVATALAHRPHAGGHRNAVDLRLHPERRGARAYAGSAGDRRHRRGTLSRSRPSAICTRSSAPPMTTS